jgi:hypothetical protein
MNGLNRSEFVYWYRQQVVDKIHELYLNNHHQGIFLPQVIADNDIELLKSSIILFGSWENALHRAGISSETIQQANNLYSDYWSPTSVIEQIQALNEAKFDLSSRVIRATYPELFFASTDKRTFGSWVSALDDAEVELKKLKKSYRGLWTLDRIFSVLHDYDLNYGNIQPEFIKQTNPSLYSCSRRYFRYWSELVRASGLKLDKNLFKVILEPLKTNILMDFLTKIFKILNYTFSENSLNKETGLEGINSGNSELSQTIQQGLSDKYLEIQNGKKSSSVFTAYRSWGYPVENLVTELLKKYEHVICYYSIGEPRVWIGDNVEFINIAEHFPILSERGRDNIISELSLLARGGIPIEYNEQYSKFVKMFKEEKKIRKEKKS